MVKIQSKIRRTANPEDEFRFQKISDTRNPASGWTVEETGISYCSFGISYEFVKFVNCGRTVKMDFDRANLVTKVLFPKL